nr:MAG TPA: hypothetical protein [Caudoviricetes sp.]
MCSRLLDSVTKMNRVTAILNKVLLWQCTILVVLCHLLVVINELL